MRRKRVRRRPRGRVLNRHLRAEPNRRTSLARPARIALLAALPWAWFPLRDLLGVVGDPIAILLPVLVVVTVVAALAIGRRRAVPFAASVLLAGTVAIVTPWTPADAGTVSAGSGVTLASANVTGKAATLPALRAVGADVLVVAENSKAVDKGLAAAYPYHVSRVGPSPSVGVYSRFPLRLLQPPGPDLPGMRVAVDAPSPFVLYALHVPRPWWGGVPGYQVSSEEHHRIVTAVAAQAAREPGAVVLAGDFNSTDRGRDYRLLTDATGLTDAMRDGWVGPTSVTTWRLFLLRIDHILVTRGWCGDATGRFVLPQSDHDGITATIGPCASG
ncbi:MAG TPA: endonuclease/exonuclease/phosphatase family protein [Pseudonocardia sp.]